MIDETATLSLGELGGEPHRTAAGQPIAVTPWSAMAQVVLLEPGSARAVLDDIDRYAAQVEDTALPPAWPMAMAVASRPRIRRRPRRSARVIAAHTPRGVAPGSAVGATISGVMNAVGRQQHRRCLGGGAARTRRSGRRTRRPDLLAPRHHR